VGDGENALIAGVVVRPLRRISDERGDIMLMLRADSPSFSKFGEIYFSYVNPGFVKAWKRHDVMTQNLAVPSGKLRVVLFDARADSQSFKVIQTVDCGGDNYCLITIPPGVWYGFKGLSATPALIANCTDFPHDDGESETADHSDNTVVPYNWNERE
jgi:dTDP-4-dehydrorhamnose 3,5-epimerase